MIRLPHKRVQRLLAKAVTVLRESKLQGLAIELNAVMEEPPAEVTEPNPWVLEERAKGREA
jgi:hypothetical protein